MVMETCFPARRSERNEQNWSSYHSKCSGEGGWRELIGQSAGFD